MVDLENPVTTGPTAVKTTDEADVLQRMIADLSSLPDDSRKRLIDTVCVFLGMSNPSRNDSVSHAVAPQVMSPRSSGFQFSEEDAPSVKQFLHDKNPQTDVERVACLAYYLARYRATPHVKTKDVTELNRESAHRPFSNTAFAVDNATKTGYLVPSIKGSKQISAYGERFVEALPDREAAKEIMAAARAGRQPKATKKNVAGAA
jgi:hypothetical protein